MTDQEGTLMNIALKAAGVVLAVAAAVTAAAVARRRWPNGLRGL